MSICSAVLYLLTVAGDATERSSGSNIIVIGSDSDMISPDVKHSFLLSSSTCTPCAYRVHCTAWMSDSCELQQV
jgi:hypothetical protein